MTRNEMARSISYVAQNNVSLNMTVFDAILLGRKPYITWDATAADLEIVQGIIEQMGLVDLPAPVAELSGERQKVMLAQALAQSQLLLLDGLTIGIPGISMRCSDGESNRPGTPYLRGHRHS